MKDRTELDLIKRLMSGGTHVPPSVEVLKSELRSDDGIIPPIKPPPSPLPYVVVVWKFHIAHRQLDKFHAFLKKYEANIIADVVDLKSGSTYMGTYAQLPRGCEHQTIWSHSSEEGIDKFKAALVKNKKSALYKTLNEFVSFVEEPSVDMQRLVRASALAGSVKTQRKFDPILDMLAGHG